MKQDLQIFDLIRNEKERQSSGLELIASENYVSDYVLEAMGSICTNKYAEGYSGKRYYGGCEKVDIVEDLARGTMAAARSLTRSSSLRSTASARSMTLNMPTFSLTPAPRRIWPSLWPASSLATPLWDLTSHREAT